MRFIVTALVMWWCLDCGSVEIGGGWCQWMWESVILRKNWLHEREEPDHYLEGGGGGTSTAGNELRNQVCGLLCREKLLCTEKLLCREKP